MRGGYSKTYVKISVTGWLHGSIRWQLDPDERGVWADLIVMAGQCRLDGFIADNDKRPFPMDYIANHLNISRELLDRTLEKCINEGRIELQEGAIFVINFKQYQDEYTRQKPYRQKSTVDNEPKDYEHGQYQSKARRK